MFTSKSTDHIAFLSRQLSHLSEGKDLHSALAELKNTCPKQYATEIKYLEDLLSGDYEDGPTLGPNPYRTLSRLLPEVADAKGQMFRGFVDYVRQSKVVFETYWAGVVGMIWYLGALSSIMIVVSLIFGLSTIPAFQQLFNEHGAELPALTTAVFRFGGFSVPTFALIVSTLVGAIIWFVALFHRRIQRLEPLPKWPPWIPLVGRVSKYYNLGLMLNFSRLLMESGVSPDQAIKIASHEANVPDTVTSDGTSFTSGDFGDFSIISELAIASRLGNLRDEVAYQCEEHIGKLSLVLVDARDRFSLILKIIIYAFVATLVVAMYLPIFKLGSVI